MSGLEKFIARGECEHSEVQQLGGPARGSVGEGREGGLSQLARFIFSIPEGTDPGDSDQIISKPSEANPAKRTRFTDTSSIAVDSEGFRHCLEPPASDEQTAGILLRTNSLASRAVAAEPVRVSEPSDLTRVLANAEVFISVDGVRDKTGPSSFVGFPRFGGEGVFQPEARGALLGESKVSPAAERVGAAVAFGTEGHEAPSGDSAGDSSGERIKGNSCNKTPEGKDGFAGLDQRRPPEGLPPSSLT